MRITWSVRWRGLEEEFRSREDALDRWDQLDAWGIFHNTLPTAAPDTESGLDYADDVSPSLVVTYRQRCYALIGVGSTATGCAGSGPPVECVLFYL